MFLPVFIMKIKDLDRGERPRERLLASGAAGLSTTELLAILLRSGTRKKNVKETAEELFGAAGNSLTVLSGFSPEKMTETEGIGPDKAATVSAAMELGKRFMGEQHCTDRVSITGPKQIFEVMRPIMKGLDHEECWIFFLNRANYVLSKERLSSGGMSATVLDTKVIIRKALEKRAHGLILVHNHPSGNPHPGSCDVKQTEVLKRAAALFDISLVDHIIVTDDRYYSFSDDTVAAF